MPKSNPDPVQTAFVVLSDLHFGNDLYEGPGTPLLYVPFSIYGSDRKVTRYLEGRCRGHFAPCVKRLPQYLAMLLWRLKRDGYQKDNFDLFILLGDQSTLTDERSYRFLREYLRQDEYETIDADGGGHSCLGLGIKQPEMLLAIPGNHDKLLRSTLNLYNNEFSRKLELKEEVRKQRCAIAVRQFGEREFIFILVDASTYCTEDLKLDASCRIHLAGGNVSRELREDVGIKLTALRNSGELDADLKLKTSFVEAMKILLVHYAVDGSQFGSGLEELVLPHSCEGLKALVDMLISEFQLGLVLHGHLHFPLLYNYNGVQVISATTATRVDKDSKTGFFMVKVFQGGTVLAEHHVWTGVDYTPDPDKSLSGSLGQFPGERGGKAA
jgi:calcineurin-like phosphoesterase family protein